MMYGQMTAGSWIYIGSQGILQGTYETFAECVRKYFGGNMKHRLIVSGGIGGMSGAQPLAATMTGATYLGVDIDPKRIKKRLETRYIDKMTYDYDEAGNILAVRHRTQGAPSGQEGWRRCYHYATDSNRLLHTADANADPDAGCGSPYRPAGPLDAFGHDAHGSINEKMLKVKQPLLCQQCHQTSSHPGPAYPAQSRYAFIQGCMHCHPTIHGSVHPSGNRFFR